MGACHRAVTSCSNDGYGRRKGFDKVETIAKIMNDTGFIVVPTILDESKQIMITEERRQDYEKKQVEE